MRIQQLLAAAAACTLLLSGCAPQENQVVNYEMPEEVSHTLRFFGNKYEPTNVEVIEDILTGYMTENSDVSVGYESVKGADYYDALHSRESAGRLDDVFMINHDTGLVFQENGSLADLTELVQQVPFSESMLSQMASPDGRNYWVPTTVSAFGLYCNTKLLEQYGQPIPHTLPEWEAVCDAFVQQGITPIVANNDISLKTLVIARGFYPFYEAGTEQQLFDRLNSGEDRLSDYLGEGFALAQSFCQKGYIDAETAAVTKKTSDDLEQFAQGESPFLLTGVWAAGRVKEMNPDLAFEVVPYPVLESGPVLVINPDVRLSVSAESTELELAKDFVSYFLRPENIARFADNQSSFSPLQDEYQPSLSEVQGIVDSYRTGTPVIGSDSHIRFPIWDITADASKALLEGKGLDVLLAQMDMAAAAESIG